MASSALFRIAGQVPLQDRDGDCLRRFIETRDEAAFAELVRRHGPAVYGICRRAIGDHQLAEDSFQAVFVILARKARTIRTPDAVAGWLFGVARHAAARAVAMRRRTRKEQSTDLVPERTTEMAEPADDSAILECEIAKLPEGQRVAVILCEIEGLSRAQAATRLGIAEGTLSSRLANARKQLALRLRERGIAPALAFAALTAVPPALSAATIQSATHSAAMLAPTVAKLTREALHMMFLSKLKLATVALVVLMLGVGSINIWEASKSVAAPVPKLKDAGLIWTHNTTTGELVAYTPAGQEAERLKLPAGETFLSLTPDGSQILYAASAKEGIVKTYHLRPFGENTVGTNLGLSYTSADGIISWSRDGKRFLKGEYEDVRKIVGVRAQVVKYDVIDVSAKTITQVQTRWDYHLLCWAPDEKQFLGQEQGAFQKKISYGLGLMTIGSEPTPLALDDDATPITISDSTDGKTLLVGGWKRNPNDSLHHAAYRLDTSAGTMTELFHEDGQNMTRVVSSPDRAKLAILWAYTTDPPEGWDELRLSVADADGKNRKTITLSERAKGKDLQDIVLLGWFPTKASAPRKRNAPVPKPVPREGVILISSWNADKPLEIVKPDGTGSRIFKLEERSWPHHAKLSPDGKRVIYEDYRPVKVRPLDLAMSSIRMLDLEAIKPVPKIVVDEAFPSTTVWAADGKSIYYSTIDPSKYEESKRRCEKIQFDTFQYDPATDKRTQLKLPPEHAVIAVTSDGKTLITKTMEFRTFKLAIFLTPLKTLKPELSQEFKYMPLDESAFSPDRKLLICEILTTDPVPKFGIVIVDLATNKERPVLIPVEAVTSGEFYACWSPDGRRIAYHWHEEVPQPAGVPIPAPGAPPRKWTASRVTVCDLDGSNAKVIVKREYYEPITGLDWR